MSCTSTWNDQARIISTLLSSAPRRKTPPISSSEFQRRYLLTMKQLQTIGADVAIVYSNEHYQGDVPYYVGNTNITIEPVAAVIGKGGVHVLAGLEGCYVVEQFAARSNAIIHKVEMMQLSDSEYPMEAERLEDVMEAAAQKRPERIALFTPRTVIPSSLIDFLKNYVEVPEQIFDAQEIFWKIKYEKSDEEISLIKEAARISDIMLEGMISVLQPGMTEMQIAQWAYNIAFELGAEAMGFQVMVTSGPNNRTIIAPASNRIIQRGDYVHLGVAPACDGLTACQRVSVVADSHVSTHQQYWLKFIDDAFNVSLKSFTDAAYKNLPGRTAEQAVVDFYHEKSEEISRLYDLNIDMVKQKPYASYHNTGYTECLEFYGALTTKTDLMLGNQIANMLDVAVKGFGNTWNEIVIPDIDYIVTEKTVVKQEKSVELLNHLPLYPQQFIRIV